MLSTKSKNWYYHTKIAEHLQAIFSDGHFANILNKTKDKDTLTIG